MNVSEHREHVTKENANTLTLLTTLKAANT